MNAPWALLRAEDLTALPGGGSGVAGPRWWRFERPTALLRAELPEDVPRLLDEVEAATGGARGAGGESRGGGARWAVGFVAYEAAAGFDPALRTRPLPAGVPAAWFGLFDPPEPSMGPAEAIGTSETPGGPAPALAGAGAPVASLSDAEYLARLAVIRRAIERGETYQVNFTYRLRCGLGAAGAGGGWDARVLDLFGRLDRAQASPYAACLALGDAAVCSVSPELFFRRTGRRIECRPMKGTAPRGRTGEEDRRLAAALSASAKERAENLMIVDMVRNDLGRVAKPGSVRVPALFEVERYDTVLQMTSRVEAQSAASLAELFAALFPCASVTGAPKVSTMELVAALEDSARGVYTGAVGVVAPGGDARFSVAIRTAWVERRADAGGPAEVRIEYGTGGGIVWDSAPARELEETRLKALALRRALEPTAPDFELLETLLWTISGGFYLLERHLARLAESGEYFGFAVDLGRVGRQLEETAQTLRAAGEGRHRVRLLCGRRGGVRVETCALGGAHRRPARLALASAPVDSEDVFLCHKTTRREVYERALADARARAAEAGEEIDDVVLWNERGELTETTIANLVLEIAGEALTPPLECGLLAGTLRAELLARGRVRARVLTVGDLARAERVLLVNSVRGCVPARLVDAPEPLGKKRAPRPVEAGGY